MLSDRMYKRKTTEKECFGGKKKERGREEIECVGRRRGGKRGVSKVRGGFAHWWFTNRCGRGKRKKIALWGGRGVGSQRFVLGVRGGKAGARGGFHKYTRGAAELRKGTLLEKKIKGGGRGFQNSIRWGGK